MGIYLSSEAPKIFGIGLSRTGTTSLNSAFEILGYRAMHWRIPAEGRLIAFEDAYIYDALTDINATWMFESLYYVFPNARFVYTTRPLNSWKRSIVSHFEMKTPKQLLKRLENQEVALPGGMPLHEKRTVLFQAMYHALYTSYRSWEEAYLAHDRRVRRFFADKPGKMLELDIFDGLSGWEQLCPFLGKPVPNVPYPSLSWEVKGSSPLPE